MRPTKPVLVAAAFLGAVSAALATLGAGGTQGPPASAADGVVAGRVAGGAVMLGGTIAALSQGEIVLALPAGPICQPRRGYVCPMLAWPLRLVTFRVGPQTQVFWDWGRLAVARLFVGEAVVVYADAVPLSGGDGLPLRPVGYRYIALGVYAEAPPPYINPVPDMGHSPQPGSP